MKITAKDIAKEAGVSEATVSLILNGRPARISNSTKEKVLKIAKQYNFSCNQIAVSLATKKTRTLGIILPNLTNALFPRLAAGVEKNAQENGYALFLCNCEERSDLFLHYLDVMQRRCIDGLIILLPSEIDEKHDLFYPKALNALQSCQVPFVLVERKMDQLQCDFVSIDNQMGGEMATDFLIKNGHTRIGHITGSPYFMARTIGYKNSLHANGVPVDESLIVTGDFSVQSGYLGAKELFKKGVTAIFTGNDLMAIGVFRAALEMGVKIPDDVSVIGFDDDPVAVVTSVPLTTIRQPGVVMGEKACKLLLNRINESNKSILSAYTEHRVAPVLIERESIKCIKSIQ